jgi:hypothetical protein
MFINLPVVLTCPVRTTKYGGQHHAQKAGNSLSVVMWYQNQCSAFIEEMVDRYIGIVVTGLPPRHT